MTTLTATHPVAAGLVLADPVADEVQPGPRGA
ncbi:hypothetical protein Ae406Ps2_3213c [Pseudonocardia sp. Ae406_Ps2]|nr:hypothetical protein Ae331Ps2_2714 [Pseudonocardia sp. Ae331_Ps2]OLM03213.1 hypothetical protein Ae406Ps2_3213c [Pseudonocardia sp. Ae406_Ps2]OLM11910.1 hypothetical protein Ae505Ps2_2036 [Pseudonocardia sp. Ae505_Ps2]OLM24772.1 hypothetical protein Ae706Ps2_3205c [Pseudonocardia sp. Ae706_Ps2]